MSKRKPRNNGRFGYVTAGISTTLVLILVGTVVFFGTMADNLSRALRENFTVEVLLSDSLNHEQAYDLQTTLKQTHKSILTIQQELIHNKITFVYKMNQHNYNYKQTLWSHRSQ